MNVDIRISVRIADLIIIDLAQPVVGRDRTGVGKDQTADRICNGTVFLDTPVKRIQIIIDDLLIVQRRFLDVSDILTLSAVQNICFRNIVISRFTQHLLHGVLNLFNTDLTFFDLRLKITGHTQ